MPIAQMSGRAWRRPQFSYVTVFSAVESPLSQGGAWDFNNDPFLTNAQTTLIGGQHVAHGTMTGGGFNDSLQTLNGFSVDHGIEAIVWKDPTIPSGSPFAEIEILLRMCDTMPESTSLFGQTRSDGYEINMDQGGTYFQLGRHKRDLLQSASFVPVAQTGDIIRAEIRSLSPSSCTIKCWWNGRLAINYTDSASPPQWGGPSIGFFVESGMANNRFGLTAVRAWDIAS